MRILLFATTLIFVWSASATSELGAPENAGHFKVLVFSKTTGFRHQSIPDGIALVKQLGADNHFDVDVSEDATVFTDANLGNYRVVIFLNTTGNILDDSEKSAFERYIKKGGGFVGVHSAADTEYSWPWYGGLVGAYFKRHPAIQKATVKVEDRTHPSTSFLNPTWERTDEWYEFRADPRGQVHVLASLDESTYKGGTMGDHPIVWCQMYDGGRSWYTGLGHTSEGYSEPEYRRHLLGGIEFAAGVVKGNCRP